MSRNLRRLKHAAFTLTFAVLNFLPARFVAAQTQPEKNSVFVNMEAEVAANKLPHISSILVARDGRLIYEKYFGDGSREKLNDTRSATKTLTALVMGRAIEEGQIRDIEVKVIPFFPDLAPVAHLDELKSDIRLKDLLTMSSAFLADDADQDTPGNEDRMHEQRSWTRWAVDLPTRPSCKRDDWGYYAFHYATVNAFLVGQVIQRATHQPIDEYIAKTLLMPLGITQYEFQRSPAGEVMTGGGLKLSSIALLRIGQLMLDRGIYHGRQVIPASWVDECLTLRRADTEGPGIGYGYLIWHLDFPAGNSSESGWFMAGNGGNIVLILPKLHAVAVVTRTDYNAQGTAGQTIGLVSKFILPGLEESKP